MTEEIWHEEVLENGSTVRTLGDLWRHPGGDQTITLDINWRGACIDPRNPGRMLPRILQRYIFLGQSSRTSRIEKSDDPTVRTVVVPFGQTVVIPQEHRNGIQRFDKKSGVIIGGGAPQLRRVHDATPARLHPSIDPAVVPIASPVQADPGVDDRLMRRAARGVA